MIWDWGCSLRREGYVGPVRFMHNGVDYYEKISDKDSLEISRCSPLFDRNPYFLVMKEHERTEFVLLWSKLRLNTT